MLQQNSVGAKTVQMNISAGTFISSEHEITGGQRVTK